MELDRNVISSKLSIGSVEIFPLSMREQLKRHPFQYSDITLLDLDR